MRVVIRRAADIDAGPLAELAARVFHDTFAEYNTKEDMDLFLGTAYSEVRQLREIQDPSITTLLVECDGELCGYAQIKSGHTVPSVTGSDPIEIMRFYIDRAFHGRGLAQQLMSEVEAVARGAGAKTIWLGVWERNERAIAFYRKCGFRHVGEVPFLVGNDLQTDLVLERPLH